MSLAGGAPVPLTSSPGDEFSPSWSPDGHEVAFQGGGGTTSGEPSTAWVVSAEGGTPARLAREPHTDGFPRWSPDGLHIVFFSTERRPLVGAWIVSRDTVGGPWSEPAPLADFFCARPDWAPDGSGVICLSAGALVVVSLDGRAVWRRDLATTDHLRARGKVHYSRDGRTIFVGAADADSRFGIWAIPVAGGPSRLVVALDDPELTNPYGFFSVGPDRLYVTVAQYESDIWVATLRY
jgi:hypothetical protein